MHSAGVVEDEPVHELLVELHRLKEESLVEVGKLFLYRPIEPLTVSVHLRRPRIGVVVNQMKTAQLFVEVLFELWSVVGEHERR